MRCFVINLDRAPQRAAHIATEFAARGVPYERFPAADGREPLKERSLLSELVSASRGRRRDWAAGEIGCLISHYRVWQKIAAEVPPEGRAAVFEDDVLLADGVARLLDALEPRLEGADIVKLDALPEFAEYDMAYQDRILGVRFHRLRGVHCGCAGYVISGAAANRLVSRIKEFDRPVDNVVFDPRHPAMRGFTVVQAVPSVVAQSDRAPGAETRSGLRSGVDAERKAVKTTASAGNRRSRRSMSYRAIRHSALTLFALARGRWLRHVPFAK